MCVHAVCCCCCCRAQVFECWLTWTSMGVFNLAEARTAALGFLQKLAVNLKDKGKVRPKQVA